MKSIAVIHEEIRTNTKTVVGVVLYDFVDRVIISGLMVT
jgi:hypothetical protein